MIDLPQLSKRYLDLLVLQNVSFVIGLSAVAFHMYQTNEYLIIGFIVMVVLNLIVDTVAYWNTVLVEVKSVTNSGQPENEVNND